MHINAGANSAFLELFLRLLEFYNIIFKIKHEFYIDPGSASILLRTSVKNSAGVLAIDSTVRASTRVLKARYVAVSGLITVLLT